MRRGKHEQQPKGDFLDLKSQVFQVSGHPVHFCCLVNESEFISINVI